MVSKRQKLARKRFKEEHPEKFPAPEPTPPKDPTKPKKKNKFKKKKEGPRDLNKRSSGKKHPLRVPGMKPGESCHICKAADHIAKNCPEKDGWEKNKTCLFCRQRGHSFQNCMKKSEDHATDKKFCYNCGDSGHSLSKCPQPLQDGITLDPSVQGGTKFAKCFICNEQGHLIKNCPKNTHGIYPKGGCCNICGGVTHLAKDCPKKVGKAASDRTGMIGKFSDFEERPKSQVTKFFGGDDLEDDFTTGDTAINNKDKTSDPDTPAPNSTKNSVKLKSKKEPKVVNFTG